jgi:anion-transporting  ArsA/GET3 family ATPase
MTTADQIASINEFIADATDALTDPAITANSILAAETQDAINEAKRQITALERADYLQATEHFDNIG